MQMQQNPAPVVPEYTSTHTDNNDPEHLYFASPFTRQSSSEARLNDQAYRRYRHNDFNLEGLSASVIPGIKPLPPIAKPLSTSEVQSVMHLMLHRIRSPLTAAMGYQEMIENREGGADKLHRGMRAGMKDIKELMDQLQLLADRPHTTFQSLDLADLLFSVPDWAPGISSNMELNLKLPESYTIEADVHHLKTLIAELLKNAAANARQAENPSITVHLNTFGYLLVTNNGPAIPKANIEQVFVPLFSTYDHKQGLGLPYAGMQAEAMNMELALLENRDDRITFGLKLPS